MAENRAKWPQALDKVFRKIVDETEKKFESKLTKIFNVQSSENAYEQDAAISGYGQMELTAELQNIPYEDRVPGWETTYRHLKYTKAAAISQEMIDDNKWNMVRSVPRGLALTKMRTLEQAGADLFNYGFVIGGGGKARFTGGDGQALFSVSHVNREGTIVQSNLLTAPLTQSSLQAATLLMKRRLDMKGQIISFRPTTLLVPTELTYVAKIILKTAQEVGSDHNDINPMYESLELIVWDYLESPTAWFLIDKEAAQVGTGLNFFIRKDEGVQGPKWEFDNDAAKWKVQVRFSVGYSDWMPVVGSTGDGS